MLQQSQETDRHSSSMASSETPVTEKRGQDRGKNHSYKSGLEIVLLSVVIVMVVLVLLLPITLYHLPLPSVSTLLLPCAWLAFSLQVSLGLVSNVATASLICRAARAICNEHSMKHISLRKRQT